MTSAQVVETSVTVIDNSPFQDYPHPDDVTPGFKPFREGTFFIWGGRDWPGPRRGGSLVNFLQIGEGQTCFFFATGGGSQFFFGKETITPCCLVDSYSLTNTRSI